MGAKEIAAIARPRPIAENDDVSSFDCGNDALNAWFQSQAKKNEGATARTDIAASGDRVVGIYGLAAGSVDRNSVPKRMRHANPTDVPIILIGRLAIDRRFQARGFGSALLKDALIRAAEASRIISARAVLVHAIDDRAAAFHRAFGFQEFPGQKLTLMMPMETIGKAQARFDPCRRSSQRAHPLVEIAPSSPRSAISQPLPAALTSFQFSSK